LRPQESRECGLNIGRDDAWFVLIVTSDRKLAAVARRSVADDRSGFSDPADTNIPLTGRSDEVFGARR
jgi:hypothetical protein